MAEEMLHREETRNTALDGLRGLAALAVIFYHGILHREDLIPSVLLPSITSLTSAEDIMAKLLLSLFNGHSAVLLFFVLSGFVLRQSLERRGGNFIGTAVDFVLSRVWRLYPALILCMAGYYALSSLYAFAGWPGFPAPDLKATLLNAALLKTVLHGPSTTLQGEMLAIPFILVTFFAYRRLGSIGLMACLAFSIFAFDNPQMLVVPLPNMNAWLPAFLFGMLVADQRLAEFFRNSPAGALSLLLALFLGLRMFAYFNASTTSLAQIFLSGALVACVFHADPRFALVRLLNSPPLQLLGRISYSLYLLNVLVLLVIWSLVDRTDLYQQHPILTGLGVGLLATLLSLPISAWSARVVEQGGIRLWKNLRDRYLPRPPMTEASS